MGTEQDITNAYKKNEASANKHMTFALLFTAFLLFLVWFGYFFKLFDLGELSRKVTIIIIPFVIVLLCIPMFFIKTKITSSPKYKYFATMLLVLAISILNVVMPKHAILGWAACIVITAHYYSPRLTKIVFAVSMVMMLISLGFGTFYGEYDANLLAGELNKKSQVIFHYKLEGRTYPDTPAGRYIYLKDLIAIGGENRFVKIFTQYYLGRALLLTLIFFIVVFLNKRTKALLASEISSNNENEKNKTELEVAKEIQLNTLPAETLSSLDVEIAGELKAAKEVGGDLYDYVDIDKDHVAFLIGDVSGKGVPAAMFMMKTITSFRDFATKGKTPSQILKEVNASINKGNKTGLFVTCFLAILDKRDGKVVYANAGHNPPIIGSNGNYRYLKCNSGFLLGCLKETFIKDEEITLKPGESITLYTDGITEARNAEGEFFGEERFINLLNKHDYTCLVEFHHAIKDGISSFVMDAPQSDDITFLTFKYRGDNYSYKEMQFEAKKENMINMLAFINDFAKEQNLSEDLISKLVIVGDEVFSNIIKYGYQNSNGDIFVRLLYDIDKKEFAMTVIDKAIPFNQLEVNRPELSGDAKKVEIGGLGLLIVKKIMDQCAYDRINGKNILVLKKTVK